MVPGTSIWWFPSEYPKMVGSWLIFDGKIPIVRNGWWFARGYPPCLRKPPTAHPDLRRGPTRNATRHAPRHAGAAAWSSRGGPGGPWGWAHGGSPFNKDVEMGVFQETTAKQTPRFSWKTMENPFHRGKNMRHFIVIDHQGCQTPGVICQISILSPIKKSRTYLCQWCTICPSAEKCCGTWWLLKGY